MSHTLLCPNQLRHHGLIVDDIPVQYLEKSTHSIFIEEANLRIPLHLNGVISGFTTRQLSMEELADVSNHYVEMTLATQCIDQTSTQEEEYLVITTVDNQRQQIAAMKVERYKEADMQCLHVN
jgi:hypothetical protein